VPRTRPKQRAPWDRLLTLAEAGPRAGYTPQSLRKKRYEADGPPLFKRNGRWVVWMSDLDEWVRSHEEAS
jgi:hypothetical protein